MDFKNFHVGTLIKNRANELEIGIDRLCNFLNCTEEQIEEMYESEGLNTQLLLRWCKILEYDFFRIYSHHLILYAPPGSNNTKSTKAKTSLPEFRKNLYSQELIDFILDMISSEKKTKLQVIKDYGIPKTTLYKWISKKTNFDLKSQPVE